MKLLRVWPLALLAFFLLQPAALQAVPASKRTAPSRMTAYGQAVLINGIEYVSAAELARKFGYSTKVIKPAERLALTNGSRTIELQINSRECSVDDLRVMLGDAVRLHKGSTFISRIDAERFLAPMIRPGSGQASIPALKVIALDPGHGGQDSGKVNERLKIYEKTMVLDLAIRLEKLLKARGYKVVLTRRDDRFLELADRPQIATKAKADLLISLHFNAAPQSITGIETFTMTPQHQFSTDDPDRKAADIHILNPGNSNDHWNAALAYFLNKNLLAELRVPDRGIKRARFAVLRLATCPAVLVESGYLSNDSEARKIATPAYRQTIAEAIAKSVDDYASALKKARGN